MRWLVCWTCLACAADAPPSDLRTILEGVPERFRPEHVVVEIDPRQTGVVARPETGSVLVSPRRRGLDRDVWLHEIGHLVAHGPRPEAETARRLARAIDEAVADYYAATLTGSPVVGTGASEARDLSDAPALRDEAWALLGLPRFDPYPFGWALAGIWWRMDPFAGALLEDLLSCLSSAVFAGRRTPRDVVHALAERCPARSRARIARSLAEWIPSELLEEPS